MCNSLLQECKSELEIYLEYMRQILNYADVERVNLLITKIDQLIAPQDHESAEDNTLELLQEWLAGWSQTKCDLNPDDCEFTPDAPKATISVSVDVEPLPIYNVVFKFIGGICVTVSLGLTQSYGIAGQGNPGFSG